MSSLVAPATTASVSVCVPPDTRVVDDEQPSHAARLTSRRRRSPRLGIDGMTRLRANGARGTAARCRHPCIRTTVIPIERELRRRDRARLDRLRATTGRSLISARLPVVDGVCQPMGIVHGGVYAAIGETLASMGTAAGGAAERRHPARAGEQHELPPSGQRGTRSTRSQRRSTAAGRVGSGTSRCATTTAACARRRASRSPCVTR